MIIRGTTPTIEISTDVSLVDCEQIYVTLKQGIAVDNSGNITTTAI